MAWIMIYQRQLLFKAKGGDNMREEKRQGSILTSIITALLFFLVLALFGKSVQAEELQTLKNKNNPVVSIVSDNINDTIQVKIQ